MCVWFGRRWDEVAVGWIVFPPNSCVEVLTPITSLCGLMRSFEKIIILKDGHPNKKKGKSEHSYMSPISRLETKPSEPSRLWCFVVDTLEWKRFGNTWDYDFLRSQVRGHWVSSRCQPAGGAVDWNSLLWKKAKKFVWVDLSNLWSVLRWEQRSRDAITASMQTVAKLWFTSPLWFLEGWKSRERI